ncbi:MAG: SprB repeat-containing protein [Bacteroidetes bacterium]|nr:SprB repeat-containing protein [Bacteroidota bacterium]
MQFIIQKALFRLKPVLFFLLSGISPCCFLTGNASPLKANLFTNCSIDSFVVVNPLCNAICSGEIQVFAQGSGTLFYQWPQIPGAGSAMVSGLCAGTYSVIITDSAGCISMDSVTISEPPPILFDLLTTTTTCPGACSGSVSVIPFDTIPYTFSWPGFVSSSPILGGLCTGSYTVIVTDPQGCSAIGSASVLYDPPFQLSFSTVPATCVSFCDGTATVTASGSGPFIYQWQTGPIQSAATATGLCQGLYSVFVTDSNGCVVSDTVRIGLIPSPLTSSVLIEPSCFGSCDGTAEVVILFLEIIVINGIQIPFRIPLLLPDCVLPCTWFRLQN